MAASGGHKATAPAGHQAPGKASLLPGHGASAREPHGHASQSPAPLFRPGLTSLRLPRNTPRARKRPGGAFRRGEILPILFRVRVHGRLVKMPGRFTACKSYLKHTHPEKVAIIFKSQKIRATERLESPKRGVRAEAPWDFADSYPRQSTMTFHRVCHNPFSDRGFTLFVNQIFFQQITYRWEFTTCRVPPPAPQKPHLCGHSEFPTAAGPP